MSSQPYLSGPPPIQDAAQRKRSVLTILLSGLAGGLFSFVAIDRVMTPEMIRAIRALDRWQGLLLLVSFPLSMWLVILLHEVGHLLGGTLAGMRPVLLFVGPLKVTLGNWRPRLSWNRAMSTWGGLALAVPVGDRLTRGMLARMIFGGPAASLITGLGAWFAAASVAGPARLVIGLFAFLSIVIGLTTLIPLRSGGFFSDGAQLLQIARGSPLAEARLKMSVVVGESLSGVRPRDWSISLVRDALGLVSDPVFRTSGLSMVAAAADDSDDPDAAQEAHEAFAQTLHEGGLQAYPKAFRADLVLPIAIYLAEKREDPDAAERWMALAQDGVGEKYLLLYAKAACAAARGDRQAARDLAAQALKALREPSASGSTAIHHERLLALTRPETPSPA